MAVAVAVLVVGGDIVVAHLFVLLLQVVQDVLVVAVLVMSVAVGVGCLVVLVAMIAVLVAMIAELVAPVARPVPLAATEFAAVTVAD